MNARLDPENPDRAVVELSFLEVGHLVENRSILTRAALADEKADVEWDREPAVDEENELRVTREQWEIIRRHAPATPACFDLRDMINTVFGIPKED